MSPRPAGAARGEAVVREGDDEHACQVRGGRGALQGVAEPRAGGDLQEAPRRTGQHPERRREGEEPTHSCEFKHFDYVRCLT